MTRRSFVSSFWSADTLVGDTNTQTMLRRRRRSIVRRDVVVVVVVVVEWIERKEDSPHVFYTRLQFGAFSLPCFLLMRHQ